jgi:hypothetical protein
MSDKERLGPPPIEPMTNAAWSRVERGLFEQLDHPATRPLPAPRSRWPWIVIPAFAAAAAAIVVVVLSLRGSSATEVAVPAPSPSPITPSRVVAGDTPSMVSYGDAHLTVDAHAAIVMGREDSSPSVLVERGAVDFKVAPRERDAFVVRAGDVVVRVVGTQFRVARFEERVTVAVERGLVDVQFRGQVHRLSSGQSWSTPEQTASTRPATPSTDVRPADGSNEKPARRSNGKPVTRSNSKATTPNETTTTTTPSVAAPLSADDRAKFDYLTSIEQSAPKEAIDGYLQLAKKSEWAEVALYAAGRLAFDRTDPRARTFLAIYLKRFPRGVNAKDARDLLSRLDGANP